MEILIGVVGVVIALWVAIYTFCRDRRKDRPPSIEAEEKAVLEIMRADPSKNGVFVVETRPGHTVLHLLICCLHHPDLGTMTNHRVLAGLETKGLVKPYPLRRMSQLPFRLQTAKDGLLLTDLGWKIKLE